MAIPDDTILRVCLSCGKEAKVKEDLLLFVKDSNRPTLHFTKALCKSCNNERARNARFGPLHGPHTIARCRSCGLIPKSKSEHQAMFVKDKSYKDGWSTSLCKSCNSNRAKQHAKDFPEKFKERLARYRIKKHGLSLENYSELAVGQDGVCAICLIDGPLYIDHDHSCCATANSCGKCVRGLLCNSCNLMLGLAKDKSDILKAAIAYLEG